MSVWVLALVVLLLAAPHPQRNPAARPSPRASPAAAAITGSPADLYNRRLRRRAAMLLRLRWEELRLEELERVRAAIRRQIPVDALLQH